MVGIKNQAGAIKIQQITVNYLLIEGVLYKKGYYTPYLRCAAYPKGECILREVHEGYFACHEEAKSILRKALRQWYYWSMMNKEP